nr:probable inactive purple acid phosphatase 27 [Ipomoea batatas]
MHDVSEYTMQRKIYSALRRRDEAFDPEACGLPTELVNPEALAEPTKEVEAEVRPSSPCASGTGLAADAGLLPYLSLGLGTTIIVPLDQIHILEGMDDLVHVYNYASFDSSYKKTGKASLKFQLINQRADFSFALFTGGLSNVSISNSISFVNPKAPVYPRLALGKSWNEMTVTWTSGYNIDEAVPVVEWGLKGHPMRNSPAGTLTLDRNSMCGARRRLTASRKAEIILLRGRPPRRCRRHLDRPISDPIPPLVSSFYIIAEKQRRNRCLTLQVMRDSQRKTPDEVSTATGQTAAKSPLPARVEVVDNGG